MADQTTSRKKKKTLLSILAGLVLLLSLGLLFLPNVISTNWAGNKAKQAVNARIPGHVDFASMSISWLNGVQLQGITYDNRTEGILVKVADVSISKGLLSLATNYKALGEINITEPNAYVYLTTETSTSEAKTVPDKKDTEKTKAEVVGSAKNSDPILFPAIDGKLNITGGALTAVLPDKTEKPVLKDLELQLNVAGAENLLEYMLSFQSGDGAGHVKGKGTVTLPAEDISKLDKIQSEAKLDIENWEIQDVLSILANNADMPTGSGLLNGQMEILGSTETAVKIKGNLTAQKIKLQGGFLKSDTPELDIVEVEIDAVQTASSFILNRLALKSPLATGTVTGSFGNQNEKEILSEAVIDLAQLFSQFPSTLNLKDGIKVSDGKIDIIAKVTATDQTTHFDGSASLKKLQGFAGKKKIAWDKPVTLEAKGEQSPEGIRLENFVVQSSFLNGKGQGDLNHMQVELASDLGAALMEIEKFLQLDDWESSGKMNLNLQVGTKTEELRSVTGDVSIKNFVLQQKGRVIAPKGDFNANLATDLRLDQEMRPQEILDTVLDFHSWIGSGKVSVKNIVPPSKKTSIQVGDMDFKGTFDLIQVTTLLQTQEVLARDIRLAGKADINTRLSIKDDIVDLGDTSLTAKDILFQKAKQKFSEKTIQLTTRGSANLKEKSATLKPVELKNSAAHIIFPELIITDWSKPENSIKTSGNINLDLGQLTTLLSDFLKLPPDTTVAGQAAIQLDVDLTDPQQQLVKLDGTIAPFKVSSKNKPQISEDKIAMVIDLKGNTRDKNFTLSKFELSTVPVSLSAVGNIAPDKQEQVLSSEGSMAFDLKAISGYLKSLADLEVEMTGVSKKPFTIKANSTNGEWIQLPKNATLSTSFFAESIKGFGLNIGSLEIPVNLANSHGQIEIKGTVNRGKMLLKPAIDFSVEPSVLSIPDNSSILTGVGITEDMSNDLLAKVHPLFQGAAVSQGTVDLTMQNFKWPLDAESRKKAAFVGSLTFNDVKLQAGGLLTPLLAVMKMDEQEILLKNQPMEFVGENDRVRCSALEIIIQEEYSLILSGSIGFDQSLDYIAQVPVTRKMVSGDVYKHLEGTFISVPIGGTVSKPKLSKNAVQTALKDLILQAGTKQIADQAGKLLKSLFK